jgi:membrane associated rhomboid family serine protease
MTRRLILANAAAFFGMLLLHWLSPRTEGLLLNHLILEPLAVVRGEVWQLATYSFVNPGILGIVFALLTLWFTGSLLEGAYGGRWVAELYGTSVVGGAVIATALSFAHIPFLRPDVAGIGAWGGVFGLLMGIAVLFGDQEFLLWFVVRLKAKYMVAIYILIAMAQLLKDADSFGAALQLAGALCGYLYVRFAPRRGLAFGMSERYFGLRNEYYRWKRRRAARKFEVYMRKQNREVHFDKDGRYVDPDDVKHAGKDPNDKRWMN